MNSCSAMSPTRCSRICWKRSRTQWFYTPLSPGSATWITH
jgi:hypothetical protein